MKKFVMTGLAAMLFSAVAVTSHAIDWDSPWEYLDIHGFVSQGYLQSDTNNVYSGTEDGTFQFSEIGINFSAELTERLHAGVQFLARDLGEVGNHDLKADWAYGDFRWQDWLGIRAGKLKIPFGLYNDTRDLDMLRTSIFLPSSIYDEEDRDIVNTVQGVEVYGNLGLRALGGLGYQLQYGEIPIDTEGATTLYFEHGENGVEEVTSFELQDAYAVKLKWEPPLSGLRLEGFVTCYDQEITLLTDDSDFLVEAGIPTNTELSSTDENEMIKILSMEYTYENLVLAAEYIKSGDRAEGYYGSISYRFTDWFELGLYYSVHDENERDDAVGDDSQTQRESRPDYFDWQKDLVLSTRFDITDSWVVKLETHFVDGVALMLDDENPQGLKQDSFMLAVKTTYTF